MADVSSTDAALLELDLYLLLDPSRTLTSSSPSTDVSRFYRKRARALHPDKNPDRADAAEQFDRLQRAYELLSDAERRRAYDERWHKKEERKRKRAAEDDEMQRMRERLQQRERVAANRNSRSTRSRQPQSSDVHQRVHRENEEVIAQLRAAAAQPQPSPPPPPPRADPAESTVALTLMEPVEDADLRAHFAVYGRVEHVMTRKGKAFIAFFEARAAAAARAGEAKADRHWRLARPSDEADGHPQQQSAHRADEERKEGAGAAAAGAALSAGELASYEAATLAKLRELARRKKEQQHQTQQPPQHDARDEEDGDVQEIPAPTRNRDPSL